MTLDGLRLRPFRGLRYDPGRVSGLAAVTSPPYDVVVRPDGLHHLESADPYNIVRLILPQAGDPAERHRQAAGTLRRWQAEGVLAFDPAPACYVYEQRRGEVLQRGLIGALRLSPPEDGVVLPHEDVIAEVVAERADLMRQLGANPEPLLLSYRGTGGGEGALVRGDAGAGAEDSPEAENDAGAEDRARAGARAGAAAVAVERATTRTPLLSTTTEDGFAHRLWAITDPAELAGIQADLSTRRALVADGHHRWATYLRLRAEHRAATAHRRRSERHGPAPSPESFWEYGLVLLVDSDRYPLHVHAIHRVLPQLPLARALHAVEAAGAFRTRSFRGPPSRAFDALEPAAVRDGLDPSTGTAFVLSDGGPVCHLLDRPASWLVDPAPDGGRPEAGGRSGSRSQLDAAVLHSTLLSEVWRVRDRACEIGYLHDADAAVEQAAKQGGTAVLMRPVREETVRTLAEQGVTMPRKSTSFGPKPATGLVLRALDD